MSNPSNATGEIIRALSIRQPYAELILRGKKRFEYRSRNTNIRERVYIYASLTDADDPKAWRDVGVPVGGLTKGKIIGTVVVTGSKERGEDDYAWSLSDPKRLTTPREATNQPQPGFWRPRLKAVRSVQRPFTPAAEPFAKVGSNRKRSARAEAAPITGELICYHNADVMDCEIWEIDRPASAVSAREYAGVRGKRLWFIAGRDRPRRYYLAGWLRVSYVDPIKEKGVPFVDYRYSSSDSDVAKSLKGMIEIGGKPWFKQLQRACANFAGLQHLRDKVLLGHLETAWRNRR